MGFGDWVAGAGSGAASGAMAGPWGALIGAGIGLFGGLFGAHMQAKSADKAAQIQSASAKYQADLMAKANADAMAFQKSQAENAFLNSEAARQGNYGIFHAREGRLGTLGEEVGMGPRDIPAYVPGVDPMFGGGGAPAAAPAAGTPAAATGNAMDPAFIAQQVTNELAKYGQKPGPRGSGPGDVAAWVDYIKAGKGWEPYWQTRIGQAFQPGGFKPNAAAGGGMFSGGPQPAPYVTATPFMQPTMAPAVGMFG